MSPACKAYETSLYMLLTVFISGFNRPVSVVSLCEGIEVLIGSAVNGRKATRLMYVFLTYRECGIFLQSVH